MTTLKDRCYGMLKKCGQEKLSDVFKWNFKEDPKCVLVDMVEQEFIDFSEDEPAEDFDGLNGLLASPTNWCFKGEKDFYCLITSNDWQSIILKYDDEIYIRVQKEMIYDYRNAD